MMSRHSRASAVSSWASVSACIPDTTLRNAGQREYIPDRPGITYRDRCLEERAQIVLDDDLVLHLTEQLRPEASLAFVP